NLIRKIHFPKTQDFLHPRRVCTEARQKGFPYARTGCSLFVENVNILIDMPEDINASLNNSGIQKVEHILYSHCDPDHTMVQSVHNSRIFCYNVLCDFISLIFPLSGFVMSYGKI
ncbi:MAG: hypothetical protein Q4C77_09865, partial [Eubacteriales bacterium]|nr:hypothetical protein [Eubacteriales bacterium]